MVGAFVFLVVLFHPHKCLSSQLRSELGPVFGYLKGHTTYHISSYSGSSGVESKLEFPVKSLFTGIQFTVKDDFLILDTSLLTNLGSGTGKLKDYDWLTSDLDIQETGQAHPGVDIYSESDIDLRAYIINASIKSRFPVPENKAFVILPTLGLRYEHLSFDVYDTEQVGFGPYDPLYTVSVKGRTLDYRVEYFILYLGPGLGLEKERLDAEIGFYFCPYVSASDRDDHILRYKLSKAETRGTGLIASFSLKWEFQRWTYIEVYSDFMTLQTDGTQIQKFYAGPNKGLRFEVDDSIKSKQFQTGLRLLWMF